MITVIVQHQVKDFAVWRAVFEENLAQLWASGCTSANVLRAVDDANDVTVIVEWPELAQMQAFIKSQEGSTSSVRAGVIGVPTTKILQGKKAYRAER
jgi:hypothetical protein